MTMRMNDLYRGVPQVVELRASETTGMPTLHGHFSVFNRWTEIHSAREGHFLERVAPGAFKKTFTENRSNIKVLFNHGQDPQIGDKVLGSLSDLREDDKGGAYSVDLFDTSYNRDLLPGLEAGVYGASFRFNVLQHKFDENPGTSAENPHGLPERTIQEAKVAEFGPVTFPAYQDATAGIRSLTDIIEDVDALMRATPILLDEERLGSARLWVKRNIAPVGDETDEERSEEAAETVESDEQPEAEAEGTEDRKADHSPKDAATKSHILSESREPGRSHLLTPKREGASSLL